MKALITFSRIFVGSLFMVSGLIKANDPLGFSYKLEEYFAESALNLPFLEPFALSLAILVCIGEVVLGLAVLFGGKMRLASWSLLLLTIFFGWLTLYTATCDPHGTYTIMENGKEVTKTVTCVTDCGCFGDAMKGSIGRSLTPWESFYKDLVLFIFIIPIFIFQKKIKLNTEQDDKILFPGSILAVSFFSWVFTWWFPVLFLIVGFAGHFALKKFIQQDWKEWALAGYATIIALGFALYCFNYLPVRDYRPYAIGTDIKEAMKSCEELGVPCPENGYIYTLKNKETGEMKEVTDREYIAQKLWEDKSLEMLTGDENMKSITYVEGYESPIHDFNLLNQDGEDLTETILNSENVFLLVAYDIANSNETCQSATNNLVSEVTKSGALFYGVTASAYNETEDFRHRNQSMFEYLNADGTTLKTIIRSNPGLVHLQNGKIVGKWHYNNIPNFQSISNSLN